MGGQKVEIITAVGSTLWNRGGGRRRFIGALPFFIGGSSPFSIISVRQLPTITCTSRYYCYIFKVENAIAAARRNLKMQVIMIKILELLCVAMRQVQINK